MKLLLGFLLLILFSFEAQSQSVSSFQANLGIIYEEFSRTIINKNNCTNLSNRAYQLRTDIEGALEELDVRLINFKGLVMKAKPLMITLEL